MNCLTTRQIIAALSPLCLLFAGCAESFMRPSPTLFELEQGKVWIGRTAEEPDATNYGIVYVVEEPLAQAWRATVDFSGFWEDRADEIERIEPGGVDEAGARRVRVRWRSGVTRQMRIRRDDTAHKINIECLDNNSAPTGLGEVGRVAVTMRDFIGPRTLVQVEIKINNSYNKRLGELLLPILGALELMASAQRDAYIRQLGEHAAQWHRLRSNWISPPVRPKLTDRVHIVAVGLNTEEKHAAGWPQVRWAEADAAAFLEKAKRNWPRSQSKPPPIRELIVGDQVTSQAIGRVLAQIADSSVVCPGDTVVFFFAGHTLQERPPHRPNSEKVAYLQTWNAEHGNLDYSTVRRQHVIDTLNASQANRAFLFLDTCGKRGGKRTCEIPTQLDYGIRRGDLRNNNPAFGKVAIFSAARDNFDAYELKALQHGVMTVAVLEALAKPELMNDGCVSLTELDRFIGNRVKQLTEDVQAPDILIPLNMEKTAAWPIEVDTCALEHRNGG